jgi:hypothetical protein
MIAKHTGRCPLCRRRIVRNRSRIEITTLGWAHERCALADVDASRLLRRSLETYAGSYADHTRPSDHPGDRDRRRAS